MAKNIFDRILASTPLNADARRVVSKGTAYDPKFGYGATRHWDAPPPLKPIPNIANAQGIVGKKFGKMTVIGLLADPTTQNQEAVWVCRCVCGAYEGRKAKAIRNPRNVGDACKSCRVFAERKRSNERLGSRPITDFFEPI